jgi:hypothetical protein
MEKLNKILTKYIEPIKKPLNMTSGSKQMSSDQVTNNPLEMARLSIDLLAADHKRLKTAASLLGMSMKDLVVVSIGDFMYRKLNQATKNTLINSKNKKSVVLKKKRKSS